MTNEIITHYKFLNDWESSKHCIQPLKIKIQFQSQFQQLVFAALFTKS